MTLRLLGNKIPYPSKEYPNIKVFYPKGLTKKIFDEIGSEYAKRFSFAYISKSDMIKNIIMLVRPSMKKDIEKCGFNEGIFFYSMWSGYRESDYQKNFENNLKNYGFELKALHTSGHATLQDIKKVITKLNPKKIIPIHTLFPNLLKEISNKVEVIEDGEEFDVR